MEFDDSGNEVPNVEDMLSDDDEVSDDDDEEFDDEGSDYDEVPNEEEVPSNKGEFDDDEKSNNDEPNEEEVLSNEEESDVEESDKIVDEPLSSEQMPFINGEFAPYFNNVTEALMFCWIQKHNICKFNTLSVKRKLLLKFL